jgi:hypothetical protein
MATKRKQKQNLEHSGMNHNEFSVLNNLEDDYLAQTAMDLDIHLTSDDEGIKKQITAIKAEERLRASLAEATYKAHLNNLKQKESVQDDDVLDLCVFDNKDREGMDPGANKVKVCKEDRKKKKKKILF